MKPSSKSAKKSRLRAEVREGKLIISIGINTLKYAFEHSSYAQPFSEEAGEYIQALRVRDAEGFAKDVVVELKSEREDGTNQLHLLFDAACQEAAEQGSLNVIESGGKADEEPL